MTNFIHKQIALAFILLGVTFYGSSFMAEIMLSYELEGVTGLSLYFMNLSGALLIFTGLNLLRSSGRDFHFIVLFVLLAITRVFVFFNVDLYLAFIDQDIAKTVMFVEFVSFLFLSVVYISRALNAK